MIKMNKRFLFPLASGITFVLLICGSLTIIENKAYAQLPGLLVSCGVGQHASPTGVCCPEGMDAVHSMCMTQQQIQAREEKYGQVFSNCVSGVREVLTGNPVGGVLGCLPEKYNPLSSVSDISGLLSGKLPNVKTLSKIGTGIIKDSLKNQIVDTVKNQILTPSTTSTQEQPPNQSIVNQPQTCQTGYRLIGGFCHSKDFGISTPTSTSSQPCTDNPAIGFICPTTTSTQSQPATDCTATPNDPSCTQPAATCSDGSAPDANGNCPSSTPTPPAPENKAIISTSEKCQAGFTMIGGFCHRIGFPGTGLPAPSTPVPTTTPTTQTCPDGSTPDSNGNCPSSSPTTIDPCTQDPNAAVCNTSPPPDNTNNAPTDNTSPPPDNTNNAPTDNTSPPPDNTNNAPTDNTSPPPDNTNNAPTDNSNNSPVDNSQPSPSPDTSAPSDNGGSGTTDNSQSPPDNSGNNNSDSSSSNDSGGSGGTSDSSNSNNNDNSGSGN